MTRAYEALHTPPAAGAIALLLGGLRDYLREMLPEAEVKTVDIYGGEFDHDEVGKTEYACPAVFVACLGWSDPVDKRLGGSYARSAQMVVFVNTKHATREGRAVECVDLAERVMVLAQGWVPACPAPVSDAAHAPQICLDRAAPRSFVGENMYTRKVDAKKLALWTVTWWQDFTPLHGLDPAALPSLLTTEVDSSLRVQVASVVVASPALATEACLDFNNGP